MIGSALRVVRRLSPQGSDWLNPQGSDSTLREVIDSTLREVECGSALIGGAIGLMVQALRDDKTSLYFGGFGDEIVTVFNEMARKVSQSNPRYVIGFLHLLLNL